MSDYISRDVAIIEFMDNDLDHIQAPNGKEAVQILSDIPDADVVPMVHGRWKYRGVCGIKNNITIRRYKCSECREDIVCDCPYNFCPYCGAKMDGDDKHG